MFSSVLRCLQVFHLDIEYICNDFQLFSGIFISVLDALFKCFICVLLYVAIVSFGCFKNRPGVAHGMRVGSGWRHGKRSGQHGQRLGVARARCCSACSRARRARALACLLCGTVWTLAPRIKRPGASKSDNRWLGPNISLLAPSHHSSLIHL
jgi:hypothetical protein